MSYIENTEDVKPEKSTRPDHCMGAGVIRSQAMRISNRAGKFGLASAAFASMMWAGVAQAAVIELYEYEINIDGALNGTWEGDPLSGTVDLSGFDTTSGLGVITATVSGAGDHYVGLFVDHEIDEGTNTFYNETGMTNGGVAAAGQSWEIDEPGYILYGPKGDIYDNFMFNALDNTIATSVYGNVPLPDDISMALGWDFTLGAQQTATVQYFLTDTRPLADFYLIQRDEESNNGLGQDIYFYSSLEIGSSTTTAVPEPSSVLLLGLGLLGMAGTRYRMERA